jgi:hypothetical protein
MLFKDFYLENTLVIITPAVRRHIQVELFLERDLKKKGGGFKEYYQDTFVLPLLERMVKRYFRYFRTYFTGGGADVTAFISGIVEV